MPRNVTCGYPFPWRPSPSLTTWKAPWFLVTMYLLPCKKMEGVVEFQLFHIVSCFMLSTEGSRSIILCRGRRGNGARTVVEHGFTSDLIYLYYVGISTCTKAMIPNFSSSVDWQRWRAVVVREGGGDGFVCANGASPARPLLAWHSSQWATDQYWAADWGPGGPALKNWLNRLTKLCILAIWVPFFFSLKWYWKWR